ncbi:ankyrin repeat-containing domain, PGG domain protein [Tanacetum coccineum]
MEEVRCKRDEYTVFGIPLYEASITADWKAAKEILMKKEPSFERLMIEKAKRLQDMPGVLQMHVDVLWLEVHIPLQASVILSLYIESMIPSPVRECKNNFDQTPRELFWKEHKNEAAKCEQWMKGTASHCMVVATLISTIAFTAAFTVPGGYHQTNGIPIFTSKPLFMVFVVGRHFSFLINNFNPDVLIYPYILLR